MGTKRGPTRDKEGTTGEWTATTEGRQNRKTKPKHSTTRTVKTRPTRDKNKLLAQRRSLSASRPVVSVRVCVMPTTTTRTRTERKIERPRGSSTTSRPQTRKSHSGGRQVTPAGAAVTATTRQTVPTRLRPKTTTTHKRRTNPVCCRCCCCPALFRLARGPVFPHKTSDDAQSLPKTNNTTFGQ